MEITEYKDEYTGGATVVDPVFTVPTTLTGIPEKTLSVEDNATTVNGLKTEGGNGLHSFTAVLLPGKYAADDTFLQLTVNNQPLTVKVGSNETLATDGLNTGTAYRFKLTVGKNGLTIRSVSVNPWGASDWEGEHGGTADEKIYPEVDKTTHTITTDIAGQIAEEPTLITDAMNGSGILKVVGPMNQVDMDAISANKATITELDLSEATGEIAITFQAFLQSASLTKVKLGSNVTSIAYNAFAVCTSLQEVDLSACSNLTSIEEAAFTSCNSITTLKLPMNGKLETIGASAFINCDNIQSITFPETLTQIGDWIFGETTTIETLVFLSQEAPSVATDNNVGGDFTDLFYGSETEKKDRMSNVTIYLPNVQREDADAKGWTAFFVDESNYSGVKYGESPATVNP